MSWTCASQWTDPAQEAAYALSHDLVFPRFYTAPEESMVSANEGVVASITPHDEIEPSLLTARQTPRCDVARVAFKTDEYRYFHVLAGCLEPDPSDHVRFGSDVSSVCALYNSQVPILRLPAELLLIIAEHYMEMHKIQYPESLMYRDWDWGAARCVQLASFHCYFPKVEECDVELLQIWVEHSLVARSNSTIFRSVPVMIELARRQLQARRPVDLNLFVAQDKFDTTRHHFDEGENTVSENIIRQICSLYSGHYDDILFKKFYDVFHHARCITIEAPARCIGQLLLIDEWPALEKLRLSLCSTLIWRRRTLRKLRHHFFRERPKLREVHLSSEYELLSPADSFFYHFQLPWSQLTRLIIREGVVGRGKESYDSFRRIFHHCAPSLRYCEIRQIVAPEPEVMSMTEDPAAPVVSFPHLEELFLDCGTDMQHFRAISMVGPMLWNSAFPALKTLRLWTGTHPSFNDECLNVGEDRHLIDALTSLQRRSSFPLEKFQLFNAAGRGEGIASFLRRVPTLKVLDLRQTFYAWTDILPLIHTDTTYLPNLSCLRIDDRAAYTTRITDADYELYANMVLDTVRSRSIPQGQLETVAFIIRRRPTRDNVETFPRLGYDDDDDCYMSDSTDGEWSDTDSDVDMEGMDF
ncbi:hypothetical protein BDP27DRAFT_1367136 [Rhodocollybia butyracea]|uniref:Uncharacterized protein n=1 Tax=Rhodocollybia butyracea TaxID=206335 RepID=A0A9P5PJL0_9AGAR|nr:hypothetical protein BDP27DRAFT_1367136 [Rhodocollybia butyracea]